MPHMEFDPYLINWVETSPKPSSSKTKVGQATNSPEVNTQAVADTGAQINILSLATLKSFGFDPDTLIKIQVKVTSAVRGSQLNIRGGIFLSVCSPDHSNHHKTVRLFDMAGNVSQDYLSPIIPATQAPKNAQESCAQGHC